MTTGSAGSGIATRPATTRRCGSGNGSCSPAAREWVCAQATGETLEVAVGTGLNLPYYPTEVTLTGIDLSPVMLTVARERAADLGREVNLREANAEQLPFDDGSFDTVVCTLALCSIPDDRAAIAQMHRVLRPGGRLLLLDHVAAPNPLLRLGQRLFEQITSRIAADYQTRRPLPLLQQAGFDIETSQRSRAGTVERLRALKPPTATVTAMDGPLPTG